MNLYWVLNKDGDQVYILAANSRDDAQTVCKCRAPEMQQCRLEVRLHATHVEQGKENTFMQISP
ncbi:MAG: hypothetical protein PHO41_02150 [Eubacteriales bacterium]|nr:hypothetical protein [Eubacteriales bacterium]